MDVISEFAEAMRSAGFEPPAEIVPDGKIHRFANGKRGERPAWYLMHGDERPAGIFGDWRTGYSQTWRASAAPSSPSERRQHAAHIAQRQREAEQQRAAENAAKAELARELYQGAHVLGRHEYVTRKGIGAACTAGIKVEFGNLLLDGAGNRLVSLSGLCLLIPAYREGRIVGLQAIDTAGTKRFIASVAGAAFSIGRWHGAGRLLLAEGWATAASLHQATGWPVLCAFSCGNLRPVAERARRLLPYGEITLCADDDHRTPGNPGIKAATEAARVVGGLIAVPEFGPDRPEDATDFNDLHQLRGLDAVRAGLERRVRVRAAATA